MIRDVKSNVILLQKNMHLQGSNNFFLNYGLKLCEQESSAFAIVSRKNFGV